MIDTLQEYGTELKKTRVVIADDHPLVRQALKNVLERQDDIEVIAEASDGEEAVELALQLLPDVLIMDIKMPKLNGLDATRRIKKTCHQTAVLVLTFYDDYQHILTIMEAGAAGYLTKDIFGDEVITSVRRVAAGETVLSSSVSQQVMHLALRHQISPMRAVSKNVINDREVDMLKMAAAGKTNKEIAMKLNFSERTVKAYFIEIFNKLNANSRTLAVIIALKSGILTLDDVEIG